MTPQIYRYVYGWGGGFLRILSVVQSAPKASCRERVVQKCVSGESVSSLPH